ncbi:hypothetical protein SAMN04488168_1834 [Bacillus sp. 491mf]|nr:hypothetical protein SAMN04488168_1834 [Bacillus sp. 491mf]
MSYLQIGGGEYLPRTIIKQKPFVKMTSVVQNFLWNTIIKRLNSFHNLNPKKFFAKNSSLLTIFIYFLINCCVQIFSCFT